MVQLLLFADAALQIKLAAGHLGHRIKRYQHCLKSSDTSFHVKES